MALLTGDFGICNATPTREGRLWGRSRGKKRANGCYSARSCVRTGERTLPRGAVAGGPQGRSECACHKYQHHQASGRHTARLPLPPAGCSLSDRPFRLSRCMCRCAAQGRHAADRATKRDAVRQKPAGNRARHPCPCVYRDASGPVRWGYRLTPDRGAAALGKALPCLSDMTASWCPRSLLTGHVVLTGRRPGPRSADPLW